jgi:hypothetical protein
MLGIYGIVCEIADFKNCDACSQLSFYIYICKTLYMSSNSKFELAERRIKQITRTNFTRHYITTNLPIIHTLRVTTALKINFFCFWPSSDYNLTKQIVMADKSLHIFSVFVFSVKHFTRSDEISQL